MFRKQYYVLFATFLFVLGACQTETGLSDIKDDIEDFRPVLCPTWDCEYTIQIDMEALSNCYGWTGYGWTVAPPPEVASVCDPATDDVVCVVELHEGPYLGRTGDCYCGLGAVGDPAPDDCCYDDGEAAVLEFFLHLGTGPWFLDYYASISSDFDAECGGMWDTDYVSENVDCQIASNSVNQGELVEFIDDVDCFDASAYPAVGSSAAYFLGIDPSRSYLQVTLPSGVDTVPLSGWSALSTLDSTFLFGIIDAGSASIGSTFFSDWRFFLTNAIDMNLVSGGFTIPHTQGYEIVGRGKQGEVWANSVFTPTEDATGYLNSTTMTWQLHYQSTFLGRSAVIHLEGGMVAALP